MVNAVSLEGGGVMNAREVKAKELADRGRVVCDGSGWLVFSLTSPERYQVSLEPPFCSCPDFELRQEECKHILAVRLTLNSSPGKRQWWNAAKPAKQGESFALALSLSWGAI